MFDLTIIPMVFDIGIGAMEVIVFNLIVNYLGWEFQFPMRKKKTLLNSQKTGELIKV